MRYQVKAAQSVKHEPSKFDQLKEVLPEIAGSLLSFRSDMNKLEQAVEGLVAENRRLGALIQDRSEIEYTVTHHVTMTPTRRHLQFSSEQVHGRPTVIAPAPAPFTPPSRPIAASPQTPPASSRLPPARPESVGDCPEAMVSAAIGASLGPAATPPPKPVHILKFPRTLVKTVMDVYRLWRHGIASFPAITTLDKQNPGWKDRSEKGYYGIRHDCFQEIRYRAKLHGWTEEAAARAMDEERSRSGQSLDKYGKWCRKQINLRQQVASKQLNLG